MTVIELLRSQLEIVVRAHRNTKSYEERMRLGEKIDGLVDEIERISPCEYCGHMVIRCTCAF